MTLLPLKKITYKNKVDVQELFYSTDDLLVTNKECLYHNVQIMSNITQQVLKTYALAIHRRCVHKKTPPFTNLIAIATDSLSSMRFLSNCDDTTVDYTIFDSEAHNMTAGTGNYRSGTDIAVGNCRTPSESSRIGRIY